MSIGVAALLLLTLLPAPAAGLDPGVPPPPTTSLLVGFQSPSVNATLLASLGGTVTKKADSIGLAVVATTNPAPYYALVGVNPAISFVEQNNATAPDSNGWDSNGWDSNGWDSNGWDASAWDSNGWDSNGWDSNGWDSNGWDSNGWDSNGWDSNGWDSNGWDSNGWDSNGWDSNGWDSNGWDSNGWDSNGWDASGWAATAGNHSLFDSSWLTAAGAYNGKGVDPLLHRQWGLRAVNASPAALAQGKRVPICVVDSGVDYNHPDLAAAMWTSTSGAHGYDFVNMDADPMDDAGHGTHVAGVAAAVAGNSRGIAGMSRASIMAVKVLPANGIGTEGDLALGIAWCADNGARVISLSVGTPEDVKAVHRAVSYAFNKGIALVASVGNIAPCPSTGCIHYPASYAEVLGVTALAPNSQPLRSSATGKLVSIGAPGWGIVSTWPGSSYRAMNGTSMATPFVSAVVAQVLALKPTLSGGAADNLVVHAARDLGPHGRDPYVGYGALDQGAALHAALAH